MQAMVPLVSSSTAGPLGVVHLPRLWVKAMLHGVGALPEGYWFATKGFDHVVLTAFAVDPAEFATYVASERPTYPDLETWFASRAQSPDAAAAINARILTQEKPPERAAEHHALLGCDPGIRRGVLLNDLDDWHLLHAAVTSRRSRARIVPAISSTTAGPLGAAHLPRLWLIALLEATGALAPGYGGDILDQLAFAQLGVEADATEAYVTSALPTYVAFEQWIREHARSANPESIAALNAEILAYRDEIVRTDLLDWAALYDGYVATV